MMAVNAAARLLTLAALAAAAGSAGAQFVKGNEAVRLSADGSKKVEVAPLPSGPIRDSKPCLANAGCHPGPWRMVETPGGLMECTEPYARPGTCRASTLGATKLSRLWVVKAAGTWQQCQFPDLSSKCVPLFARPPANLPYSAVQ